MSPDDVFDLFVIGGGINGCGVARDAAGRGLKVALAEKSDLASGTSSGSTKLIHGGLRYLEYFEFGLVRKSLVEREVLWQMAPHIIHPLRFILPHHKALRPAWLIRIGLFIYDYLGGRKLLPATKMIKFAKHYNDGPLRQEFKKGFEYSDCWVDDARLVVLNARDAADRGAKIVTQTKVIDVSDDNGLWKISTRNSKSVDETYWAKVLVNASGPWRDMVNEECFGWTDKNKIRLVRGSHIVVPSMFDHSECYIFQNPDDRIVFAIPYEEKFTLIGTTDSDYEGDPGEVSITKEEVQYLCDSVSGYFKKPVVPADMVWSYSAVRPLLYDGETDAKAATRDYKVSVSKQFEKPPLIKIDGGKITTYRKLAEDVMSEVSKLLPGVGDEWTSESSLPGGNFPVDEFTDQVESLLKDFEFLDQRHARRLIRQYGIRAKIFLSNAEDHSQLGYFFGGDLYQAEVDYLVDFEWATCAEDILWRRTKEGLRFTGEQVTQLEEYLRERAALAGETD